MSIGEYVRLKREQHVWTVQEAADRIGISKAYLCQLELGIRIGNPRIWRTIGQVLHCREDTLRQLYVLDAQTAAEQTWDDALCHSGMLAESATNNS